MVCQWFVSGVGLAAGMALVFWTISLVVDANKGVGNKMPIELPNTTVEYSAVEQSNISEYLTVSTTLKSTVTAKLHVEVQLIISKDDKVIFTCPSPHSATFTVKQPSERIQIQCRDIKTARVGRVLTRRMLPSLRNNARFISATKPIRRVKTRPTVCAMG